MNDKAQKEALKRYDPIWKFLRVDRAMRIVQMMLIACILIDFLVETMASSTPFNQIDLIGIYIVILGSQMVGLLRLDRYWLKIGERRALALQYAAVGQRETRLPAEVVAAMSSDKPSKLPLVVRLDWNYRLLRIGGLSALAFVIAMVVGFIWTGSQNSQWIILFLILSIFFGIAVVCLLFAFFYAYYQRQEIEISAEGMKTRFRGQERSIRWDEVRVFAQYPSRVFNQMSAGLIFELSNERDVVRWSQIDVASNILLKPTSSLTRNKDYGWLIRRINALVAAQVDLPMLHLNLNLVETLRQSLPPDTEQAALSVPASQLAYFDPLVERMQLSSDTGIALLIMTIVAAGLTLYGVLNVTGIFSIPSLRAWGNAFFLVIGGCLLVIALFALWIMMVTQRYWQGVKLRRERAAQDPLHFQTVSQPDTSDELPQPSSIILRSSPLFLFAYAFVIGFVGWFLYDGGLASLINHKPVLANLTTALVVAIVFSLFLSLMGLKANRHYIEINETGIVTRVNMIDSYINWRDVRLFTQYDGVRVAPFRSSQHFYELAGETTVVRWFVPRKLSPLWVTDPKMSPETYSRWITQFSSYAVAHTRQPLLNLDQGSSGADKEQQGSD